MCVWTHVRSPGPWYQWRRSSQTTSTRPFGATDTSGWRVWWTHVPSTGTGALIRFGVDHAVPLFSDRWSHTWVSGGMKWSAPV